MKAEALDAVAAQVERGELDAAARGLLALWREEPHAELAEALERFPTRETGEWEEKATKRMERWLFAWREGDVLRVPPLLRQLDAMLKSELPKFTTSCFDAIATSEPDPRAGRACVKWLSDVGGLRSPSRMLYRSLEKAAKRHADPRDLAALQRLGEHGTPWASMVGALSNLAGAYAGLALRCRARLEALPPLERAAVAKLRELGERASSLPVPNAAAAAPADVEAMLSRVRAAPNDEAHRAVFLDRLLETSDPWGELIALQVARAKSGAAKVTARERSLLKQLRPRILGGLALERPSVLSGFEFARGFVVAATVKVKGVTRVTAMLSQPEFATLERVTFVRDAAIPPSLLALKEAHGVRLETLATARKKRPSLALEAVTLTEASPDELAKTTFWPELKELYTVEFFCRVRDLLALPVARHLTAVGVRDVVAFAAFDHIGPDDVNRAPPSVQRVSLDVYSGRAGLSFRFLRAGKRWRAEVHDAPPLRAETDYAPGPLEEQLGQMSYLLQDAVEVKVFDGVPEAIRAGLARQR